MTFTGVSTSTEVHCVCLFNQPPHYSILKTINIFLYRKFTLGCIPKYNSVKYILLDNTA